MIPRMLILILTKSRTPFNNIDIDIDYFLVTTNFDSWYWYFCTLFKIYIYWFWFYDDHFNNLVIDIDFQELFQIILILILSFFTSISTILIQILILILILKLFCIFQNCEFWYWFFGLIFNILDFDVECIWNFSIFLILILTFSQKFPEFWFWNWL